MCINLPSRPLSYRLLICTGPWHKMRWPLCFVEEFFVVYWIAFFSLSIYLFICCCCCVLVQQKEIRNATFEIGTNRPTIVIMMQLKTNLVIHYDAVIYPFCMAIVMVSASINFCRFPVEFIRSVVQFNFIGILSCRTSWNTQLKCLFLIEIYCLQI